MFFIIIVLLIAAAALLILLALLLKINLLINCRDSMAVLSVKMFGITVLHRKYEIKREKGEIFTLYCTDKPKPKRVVSLLDIIKTARKKNRKKSNEKARGKLFAYINKKASYHLRFRVAVGLGDASATAMLCGFIQSISGALSAALPDKRHRIDVTVLPDFSKRTFSFLADCIIKLSLADIIIGYLMYKISKGR